MNALASVGYDDPQDLADRILKLPRQSANVNPRKGITEAEELI